MTNVMNFEFHRFMKESGAAMAAAKEQAKKNLDNLLAIDVSKLSGRDLRKLRARSDIANQVVTVFLRPEDTEADR
jgi:hypothetical protein